MVAADLSLPAVDDGRRMVVRGTLQAATPLHVGSGLASARTDATVARDWDGRPVIPASAIAGVLRGHLEHARHPGMVSLFGNVPDRGDGEVRESALWVEPALLMGDLPPGWIRQRVGIDRARRAAAEGILFDLEILPAGLRFGLRLEYRHLTDEQEDTTALGALAWALLEARALGVRVGGRGATGLGRVEVSIDEVVEIALTRAGQFEAWTRDRGPGVRREDQAVFERLPVEETLARWAGPAPVAAGGLTRDVVRIHVRIVPEDPLLVAGTEVLEPGPVGKDEPDPASSDATPALAPVLDGGRWNWRPSLPGSSLRGALRSRAEMIMRTVTSGDPWRAACDPFAHRDPARSCAARVIAAERAADREARKGIAAASRKTACPVCRLFGHVRLASRVRVEDALADPPDRPQVRDHVAIDRISGSTAGVQKFDDAPLAPGPDFVNVIEVTDPEPETLGLLLLALRDLADGDLPLGRATGRGYGGVRATCERVDVLSLPESPLDGHLGRQGDPRTTGTRTRRSLAGWEALQAWCQPALSELPHRQALDLPMGPRLAQRVEP